MWDFLVIGAGSIGRRHIQCLSEMGICDICIAEPADKNRLAAEKNFDIKESFSDVDQALERDYEGVVVAVPNFLHAEVGCKVIEKKMNLLLEKPIEMDIESVPKYWTSLTRSERQQCMVRVEHGILSGR